MTYLKLCSPFIAQLGNETRTKLYELAWSLLFGEDEKGDKIEDQKVVLEEIKEQFKNLQTGPAREILSDEGKFLENVTNQIE